MIDILITGLLGAAAPAPAPAVVREPDLIVIDARDLLQAQEVITTFFSTEDPACYRVALSRRPEGLRVSFLAKTELAPGVIGWPKPICGSSIGFVIDDAGKAVKTIRMRH